MATLELDGVSKSFGAVDVVHGIDLEVADREFVVLVGPSGCGKSTILRMVAGLEEITAGEVRIDGRRANESPSRHRNLAMVFQDYALYPHMTVAANLGFGLKMNNVPTAERAARVQEIAALLQLEPYLARKPRALSGGQRQRVAMGRALARNAQLFLFDEPLSNLDAKLRIDVRTQIKLLHQELGMTSIFVTHDQTEAMTLADRIVCLEEGRIAQIGTPEELYNHPVTVFVATFIGSPQINLLPAEIGAEAGAPLLVLEDGQRLRLPPEQMGSLTLGQRVLAGLRPEDLTDLSRLQSLASPCELVFETLVAETLGSDVFLVGKIAGAPVSSRCAPGMRAVSGERLTLHADASRLHFFDPMSRRRI